MVQTFPLSGHNNSILPHLMIKPTLILTVAMAESDLNYFSSLRQKYFPAERNFLQAHLTLFHALPNEPALINTVKELCETISAFMIQVKSLVSIGNGVAFKMESFELMQLHKTLQNQWQAFLTNQDKHKLWPHITIQNKVIATEANELLAALQKDFKSFRVPAEGLQLWEYLNGPWKSVEAFSFKTL